MRVAAAPTSYSRSFPLNNLPKPSDGIDVPSDVIIVRGNGKNVKVGWRMWRFVSRTTMVGLVLKLCRILWGCMVAGESIPTFMGTSYEYILFDRVV